VPVDVVVVEALVQAEVAVLRLHSHHLHCKVSANPSCTQDLRHRLDKDHTRMHLPICSNNTETWCQVELAVGDLELAELVWVLVMALAASASASASALVVSALVLVLGLEHQDSLHLNHNS